MNARRTGEAPSAEIRTLVPSLRVGLSERTYMSATGANVYLAATAFAGSASAPSNRTVDTSSRSVRVAVVDVGDWGCVGKGWLRDSAVDAAPPPPG
jgi:hypothetical protein